MWILGLKGFKRLRHFSRRLMRLSKRSDVDVSRIEAVEFFLRKFICVLRAFFWQRNRLYSRS